ncbi:hypothetical protein ACU4HD_40760 [Cupriavidus basilensis]
MIRDQFLLDIAEEMIVDNFAGGEARAAVSSSRSAGTWTSPSTTTRKPCCCTR